MMSPEISPTSAPENLPERAPPNGAPAEVHAYVRCASRFLDLPLDDPQIARVALHLMRTKAMVALLRDLPLTPEDEPAEIFCPAPFPAADRP